MFIVDKQYELLLMFTYTSISHKIKQFIIMNLYWIIYKILYSSFRKKEKQLQTVLSVARCDSYVFHFSSVVE